MSVMGRQARRLFDLDIDEVSAVDRPANQHGLISISKSLGTDNTPEEGSMGTIYDAEGIEVFEDELEHGDVVFDDDGQELVYVEPDGEPLEGFDGDDVQKDARTRAFYGAQDLAGRGRKAARTASVMGRRRARQAGAEVGRQARTAGPQFSRGQAIGHDARKFGSDGYSARSALSQGQPSEAAGYLVSRNRNKLIAGGAGAGAATAGGVGYHEAKKSLGDTILADFSKAVTEADRQAVVVSLARELDAQRSANMRIAKQLDDFEDRQVTDTLVAKAASYGLPIESYELADILKSISSVLDDQQLAVVDRIFETAGELIFKEYGYAGGAANGGAYADIEAMASELVGKAAGGVSMEQAQVALLEHDPELYDAYLNEKMGR